MEMAMGQQMAMAMGQSKWQWAEQNPWVVFLHAEKPCTRTNIPIFARLSEVEKKQKTILQMLAEQKKMMAKLIKLVAVLTRMEQKLEDQTEKLAQMEKDLKKANETFPHFAICQPIIVIVQQQNAIIKVLCAACFVPCKPQIPTPMDIADASNETSESGSPSASSSEEEERGGRAGNKRAFGGQAGKKKAAQEEHPESSTESDSDREEETAQKTKKPTNKSAARRANKQTKSRGRKATKKTDHRQEKKRGGRAGTKKAAKEEIVRLRPYHGTVGVARQSQARGDCCAGLFLPRFDLGGRNCEGPVHVDFNFDHPNAFEHQLMLNTLRQLCQGKSVVIPKYDLKEQRRLIDASHRLEAADVIFGGGHYSPIKVERDTTELGRPLDQVLHQYLSLVKPAYEDFCLPTKKVRRQNEFVYLRSKLRNGPTSRCQNPDAAADGTNPGTLDTASGLARTMGQQAYKGCPYEFCEICCLRVKFGGSRAKTEMTLTETG
ncbi:hypothetical protein niasHT_034963 [Heterodera trifolii]|uniref:Phosphoribulokinase/uridine kinase domain-containing protein n=1 Tax=Heterodera trifolii TaxID=157864 RepID=A0ABD2IDP6_9BILA